MAPTGVTEAEQKEDSLASRRSRRSKKQSHAANALEKIRKFRETGERSSFEVGKVRDVYEVVTEDEYSEVVRKRQEDDWVVDDGTTDGYADDGREIFDDELDEDPSQAKKGAKQKSKKPNVKKPIVKPKTINKMFLAASAKAKKTESDKTTLGNDDFLDDILKEVENPKANPIKLPKSRLNPFRTPPGVPAHKAPPRRLQSAGRPGRPSSLDGARPSKMTTKVRPSHPVKRKSSDYDYDYNTNNDDDDDRYGGMVGEAEHTDQGNNMQEDVPGTDNMACDDYDYDDNDDLGDAAALEALDAIEDCKPQIKQEKMEEEIEEPAPPLLPSTRRELDDGSAWETILGQEDCKQEVMMDVNVDSSSLPLKDVNGEKVLKFYWFDAYEDRFRQPGIVYLFGKVKIDSANKFVSCCVAVKNIERTIYLLPREKRLSAGPDSDEPVRIKDVYEEFNEKIANKNKIMKFVCKTENKDYCFEIQGIPANSDYLMIKYSAEYPQLPEDLQGDTFSKAFGTNTSSLEQLLLNRKMKGPCWLHIKMPQLANQPVSYCKVEAFVNKPGYVMVAEEQDDPPPLVVMSLSMQTLINPRSHSHEIIAISALVHQEVHLNRAAPKEKYQYRFCALSKPGDKLFPFDFKDVLKKKQIKIEVMTSERALLAFFVAKIHKIDPDVLVGHDIFGFDMDILMHRINACKIPQWSRVGRLKRAIMPKIYTHGKGGGGHHSDPNVTCGRLMCDVKISSKELIRCKSYDLKELSRVVLNTQRHEIDQEDVPNMYSSSQELLYLLELTTIDSLLSLRIMYELNVLPLAHQITCIAGNVMARTLLGGRSERNEYLLLHAFSEKGFICPDKSYGKKTHAVVNEDAEQPTTSKKGRRKPAYEGGLVLEPKKGYYDKFILLLDFNSLYPSIIQEYNICFTTIDRTSSTSSNGDDDDAIVDLPDPSLDSGILPTEIRKLVERRRQVKGLMKTVGRDTDKYTQFDIRQKALKLTANSMYGCLGFSHSRFYAKPLAALVTSKGREILMKTKDLVQQMHLDVIYGDTDSIMINTNSTDLSEVRKIGNKVKSEVNKLYRLLEIDIDGIFKSMLLLKKKKYAAICVSENEDGTLSEVKEMKGLDIVRRDWSDLAKDAGNFVLAQILSSQPRETILDNIHEFLIKVGEDVKDGKIDMQKFIINKQLTKSPHDYPDKKSLPHVHVALWMMSKSRKVGVGDTIPYIICDDGSTLPASQRAYHPDEFQKSDTLKIDNKYYLASQVHPVVARLCDPIEGTDASRIAQCLGLDPSGYRSTASHRDDETDALLGSQVLMTDEERFKDCIRLVLKCRNCEAENTIETLAKSPDYTDISAKCAKCNTIYETAAVINQVTVAIRRHIKEYYNAWQKCEDPSCDHRTRQVPLTRHRGLPLCPRCHRAHILPMYTDTALYNQILYYSRLFDLDHACKDKNLDAKIIKAVPIKQFYHRVHSCLHKVVQSNAYSEVNLAKLFVSVFG